MELGQQAGSHRWKGAEPLTGAAEVGGWEVEQGGLGTNCPHPLSFPGWPRPTRVGPFCRAAPACPPGRAQPNRSFPDAQGDTHDPFLCTASIPHRDPVCLSQACLSTVWSQAWICLLVFVCVAIVCQPWDQMSGFRSQLDRLPE